MKDSQENRSYQFGAFLLDVPNCRLTLERKSVPLTPKEFDILILLIENAGQIVTKDDLLSEIWKDAFVEEGTLTRNISWLRQKLAAAGAEDKQIIETVSKRGYRFVPAVTRLGDTTLVIEERTVQHVQIEEVIETRPSQHPEERSSPGYLPAHVKRRFSPFWIIPIFLFVGAASFMAYRAYVAKSEPRVRLAAKISPFSGLPGREDSPAFSPDGKQLVFAWNGGNEAGKMNIYVKLIGTGEPVRLTTTDNDEINPVFSPDGRSVAFVRTFPTHNEIVSMPALGGAERKLYDQASYASISFSPDGKLLVGADLGVTGNKTGLFVIDLQTNEKTRLTAPETPGVDHTPRWSPDGKHIAFIRYFSSFRREVFVVPAAGGPARQVTFDDARIYALGWNANSTTLFFTSFRILDQLNLWEISIAGDAEPTMIPTGSKGLQSLAISPSGRTIAFVEETQDENIWQIAPGPVPRPMVRSARADHSPNYSPDGSKIVFASERTGKYEVWLSNADGSHQRQITDSRESAGSPRFSPDGKSIAYDAQVAGGSNIYVIPVNGGQPRQLTADGHNNALPAWSTDGNSIFYLSNRSGSQEIWRMPAAGGDAVQITHQGAFEIFAASDGTTLIYSKGVGKAGLWTVGTDGSNEEPITELGQAGTSRSWTVSASGVWYTNPAANLPLEVRHMDLKTRRIRTVALVDKPPLNYYSSLAVAPDGITLLYSHLDQTAASIMFAELGE